MNISKQVLENRTVRLLDPNFRIDYNKFKTNIHNSPKHEKLKKRILNLLVKQGYTIICEARFKQGGIADILLLHPSLAIEVLCTETMERFESKSYPVETIAIKSIKEVKLLLKNKVIE